MILTIKGEGDKELEIRDNNKRGFSLGLENRGDDAPDDGNHVRFRLPSGSSDIYDDWQEIYRPRKFHPRKPSKR